MTDGSNEEWRKVVDAPDYEVSSLGRVRCVVRRRYLKPGDLVSLQIASNGYIVACINGRARGGHRMMCHAFHGDPPSPKHEAAHNDGDRSHNRPSNVRWATHKENCADKKRHGTENPPIGEKNGHAKLNCDDVAAIKALRSKGMMQHEIASRFNICRTTVSSITNGYNWRHL